MSGLLPVCTWLLGPPAGPPPGPPAGPPAGPPLRPPSGRGMLGPLGPLGRLILLIALAAAAEAAGRSGPGALLGPMASPRMDFEEWTPLGHGDPLKNDPTYDYVPPVLDRVHYWMEESSARRDVDLNAVPVPATMLVPPPPPPPAPTTPAPPPPVLLTATPPAYSSLNPFHHFEDRPVVPNVLFEETPFASFDGGQSLTPAPSSDVVVQHQPLMGPTPLGPLLLPTPVPRPHNPNAIRAEPAKSSKLAPPMAQPPRPPVKPLGRPSGKPTRYDEQPQLSPPPHLPPKQVPPPPPPRTPPPSTTSAPPTTTPPPTTTTTTPTAVTTTSASISSLVRGLLYKEAATTASTLTTDPLFAHYKQPVTPVQGPAYLIIQGHSKVKTYGPVLRRV